MAAGGLYKFSFAQVIEGFFGIETNQQAPFDFLRRVFSGQQFEEVPCLRHRIFDGKGGSFLIGFDFDVPRGSAEFLQTGKQITMPQVFQGCWRYFKTERIRSGAACQPLLFQPFKQFLKLRGRRFYRADSGKIVKFAVQVNIGVSRK